MPTGLCPFPLDFCGPLCITREAAHHAAPLVGTGELLNHATGTDTKAPDYEYRVLIDRSGATLFMRLPIAKYSAVREATAEASWVLLEQSAFANALTCTIGTSAQGGGKTDIDRDGSTDRGKEDNDEGGSGHEKEIKEWPAGGNNVDSEANGLKEESSNGSESGDGPGADQEGYGNGDGE